MEMTGNWYDMRSIPGLPEQIHSAKNTYHWLAPPSDLEIEDFKQLQIWYLFENEITKMWSHINTIGINEFIRLLDIRV